jgi:hypothetical protein
MNYLTGSFGMDCYWRLVVELKKGLMGIGPFFFVARAAG